MNTISVEQNVQFKLTKVLGFAAEHISETQELYTWGLNSIKTIELIVELEECFDIIFSDEELLFENFATIQRIVDRIQEKLVTS